jgi:hypothetical protein
MTSALTGVAVVVARRGLLPEGVQGTVNSKKGGKHGPESTE